MNTTDKLKFYYGRLSEIYRLQCIAALLEWDQQVYMPPQGAEARAGQMEYIACAMHQKSIDPKFLRTVDELSEVRDTLSADDQVNIRETKRVLDIERKLPEDFVSESAQANALGYSAWVIARPANDFKAVQPYLEKIVQLERKRCELVGYKEHPYDALLDIYEPGAKASTVKPLLLDLAEKLREIIPPICDKFCRQPELKGHYPKELQQGLCKRIVTDLGFDFGSGRLDTTAHPFMTTLGPKDFRITNRYDEESYLMALYGIIHETGHALYDMGLPKEYAGTPLGEPISLGVHESQSRLWENMVGRSKEFCEYLHPILAEFFPQDTITVDELWMRVNRVEPSLIRTEADEVTYSQHIVIRMLLEIALITGELAVVDLPDAWNDLYEKYLGIRPTNNTDGVLQDVHWYSGSIGYFPTYALGNLYNSMTMEAAESALPDLPQQIAKGEFTGLLGWLRENVHRCGMRFTGPQLIRNITGKDLSDEPFVRYLKQKYLEER